MIPPRSIGLMQRKILKVVLMYRRVGRFSGGGTRIPGVVKVSKDIWVREQA